MVLAKELLAGSGAGPQLGGVFVPPLQAAPMMLKESCNELFVTPSTQLVSATATFSVKLQIAVSNGSPGPFPGVKLPSAGPHWKGSVKAGPTAVQRPPVTVLH